MPFAMIISSCYDATVMVMPMELPKLLIQFLKHQFDRILSGKI
jgi:hypothetical protein